MKDFLKRVNTFIEKPITLQSRIVIIVAALLLVPTFFLPLWNITLYSNQFRDGLLLNVYSWRLEGAKTPNRDDLLEINSLNHYIGMRPLKEEDFTEFKWIPFVVGFAGLLALRAVVLGKMSKLVDLIVLFIYFSLFSLWSFYHKLYVYGHDLAPTAAVKVPPFTPPLFGHTTMANFEVYSYPDLGTLFMTAFLLLLLAAAWMSRRSEKTAHA